MSIAPSSLLLDSNIWIDLFLPERTGHDSARKLIDRAIEQEVSLFAAAITIKDVYYVLDVQGKRSLRAEGIDVTPQQAAAVNEYAWGCTNSLEKLATIVPLDQSDVWIATKLRRVHPDFEDDLIVAAMERSKASYLVTHDKKFGSHAPVATLTADEALLLMQ